MTYDPVPPLHTEARPFSQPVERAKILEYVSALGLSNIVHRDVLAARELGYRDIVAPRGICLTVQLQDETELFATFGVHDWSSTVAVGLSNTFRTTVCANDVLRGKTTLVARQDKKLSVGPGVLFVLETSFTNQLDECVLVERCPILTWSVE